MSSSWSAISSRGALFWRQWGTSLVLLPFCVYVILHPEAYTWLGHLHLIFHEAGHFFFRFFGTFMHFLGGTLMQLIMPGILVWHFLRHHYRFGAQLSLVVLGHSFFNISTYAADARARALPLLGGDSVMHDWHFMLGQLGLLHADAFIGGLFYVCGLVVLLGALLLPLRMIELDPE
ncbi:MAG: hypothetical protein AAGI71_01315 [Bacteroidota bacterium]